MKARPVEPGDERTNACWPAPLGSKAKPGTDEDRERPARALAVDVAQSLLDEPVDVGQTAHITELDLAHELDGAEGYKHAAGRTKVERPRLLEELAVLCGEPGREVGWQRLDDSPDVVVAIDSHQVSQVG